MAAVAFLAVATAGCDHGSAPQHTSTVDPSRLTPHEYVVAERVAHDQAARGHFTGEVTSATATVGRGTHYGNVGVPCTSGTLIHVKLIGHLDRVIHGGLAGRPYEPTTAVEIDADPTTGQACLVGVATGAQRPDRHATTLEW